MMATATHSTRPAATAATPTQAGAGFDVQAVRAGFPGLATQVHGKPLVYLDNAATSQRPQVVMDAVAWVQRDACANIHRGVHKLSELATTAYEGAREDVRRFIHAASVREIVFTSGTTAAINLVASSLGQWLGLGADDEVLITEMEHHSNIVPWQLLCERTGAQLKVVPINDSGDLDLDAFDQALGARTRIVTFGHVSNALGTVNPVQDLLARVRQVATEVANRDIYTVVDGAQAVPHLPVDVQALGCDFYAFSAHKMYGPTGVGVLYGREALLKAMPPYQGGGDMIRSVSFDKTTYAPPPTKFEAGTPNISGVVGLGAAVRYLESLGLPAVAAYENDLVAYACEALAAVDGVEFVGTPKQRAGVVSFVLAGIHPHDIGTILDQAGVALRTGHHCAQPVMAHFGVPATVRASFAVYNTRQEVDALVAAIKRLQAMFGAAPGAATSGTRQVR